MIEKFETRLEKWNYKLYWDDGKAFLSVLKGGVGVFEGLYELKKEELERCLSDKNYLIKLVEQIREE